MMVPVTLGGGRGPFNRFGCLPHEEWSPSIATCSFDPNAAALQFLRGLACSALRRCWPLSGVVFSVLVLLRLFPVEHGRQLLRLTNPVLELGLRGWLFGDFFRLVRPDRPPRSAPAPLSSKGPPPSLRRRPPEGEPSPDRPPLIRNRSQRRARSITAVPDSPDALASAFRSLGLAAFCNRSSVVVTPPWSAWRPRGRRSGLARP